MELESKKREPKKEVVSVRLSGKARTTLKALAKHFDTSEGDIVETLLNTYGPKILADSPTTKRRKA